MSSKNKDKKINPDDLGEALDQAERLAARLAREGPSAEAGKVVSKIRAAKHWYAQAPQKPAEPAKNNETKTKD